MTLRTSFQYVRGTRAFHHTDELDAPPSPADIEWSRQLYVAELYYQASAQVGLGAAIPYYEQDVHNRTIGTDDHVAGIGDCAFYVTWSPWVHEGERKFLDAGNLSLMVGMTIPTGDDLAGEVPGLHTYHIGSGSPEYKFSARYTGWLSDDWVLYAAASAVIDGGVNRTGFLYGQSYDLLMGVSWTPVSLLSVWLAADIVSREQDHFSGIDIDDSGGTWWYLECGVAVEAGRGVTVDASVDMPVWIRVNGSQPVADWILSLGVRYRF